MIEIIFSVVAFALILLLLISNDKKKRKRYDESAWKDQTPLVGVVMPKKKDEEK